MLESKEWDNISFITSSKIRFLIMTNLNKHKLTPTQLSKTLKSHVSAISRGLTELSEKELIICLTNNKKSKYYELSDKGKKCLEKINNETRTEYL